MSQTRWTIADMPSQAGRTAIVTGATSGIGYEAARAMAKAGAHVVLAGRNAAKAERAMASIRQSYLSAQVEFRELDTANLASVRAFATRWQVDARPIDLLLLNAGIASVPQREESPDGFERQLAANYLGHFALTGLLLDWLVPRGTSRIVEVASLAHRSAKIDFDDLQLRRSYTGQRAYGQSKLAMLMFGLELDRRLKAARSPVRSIPVHPGMAVTDIFRRGDRAGPVQRFAGHAIFSVLGQSAEQGALPLLFAATAPDAQGGTYYGPDRLWETRGGPAPARAAPHAREQATTERLWRTSETLTEVEYGRVMS